MKKLLFAVILMSAIGINACKKDKQRSTILGSWNCEEISLVTGAVETFQVNVERDNSIGDSIHYAILNFHQLGLGGEQLVYFIEKPDGTLEIPDQFINRWFVKGTGEVAPGFSKISWKYTITEDIDYDYVATFY